MKVELFAHQQDLIGEGPLWSPEEQALYWIDIGRSMLFRQGIGGGHREWQLPSRPGCVERHADGVLVLAMGPGLHGFDPADGSQWLISEVPLKPGVRFNEGKCDPQGRLWFGSMQDNFGPRGEAIAVDQSWGALFRCDSQGAVACAAEAIGISNTLAWSPDGSLFYFADSLLDHIYVHGFDGATGTIGPKRLFFGGQGPGVPDGSAMDSEGCLWNARWGAGCVLRLTPDGRIDRRIEIPVSQPSSCAFGGPGLDTLFVTSARNGLSKEVLAAEPLSGSVFAISDVGIGMAVPAMRGPPRSSGKNVKPMGKAPK